MTEISKQVESNDPTSLVFAGDDGKLVKTNSLIIAEHFGKEHRNVIRAIRNLECSEKFCSDNFEQLVFIDKNSDEQPMYEITHDGFMFLCMGFTGKKAAQWKERFIEAFNMMENVLRKSEQVLTKKDVGGIVKGVVRKQIEDCVPEIINQCVAEVVPALVEQQLASQQMTMISGVTSSQVLDWAGITNRKGLKGLSQRVSYDLRRYHVQKGVPVKMAQLGTNSNLMYDPLTCREWLSSAGKSMIDFWIKEKRGQGRLSLVGGANV